MIDLVEQRDALVIDPRVVAQVNVAELDPVVVVSFRVKIQNVLTRLVGQLAAIGQRQKLQSVALFAHRLQQHLDALVRNVPIVRQ